METYDTKDKFATFEGEIYLMFKDGIVSSVVLVDKVAKDGHIKDNTTGKIVEGSWAYDVNVYAYGIKVSIVSVNILKGIVAFSYTAKG